MTCAGPRIFSASSASRTAGCGSRTRSRPDNPPARDDRRRDNLDRRRDRAPVVLPRERRRHAHEQDQYAGLQPLVRGQERDHVRQGRTSRALALLGARAYSKPDARACSACSCAAPRSARTARASRTASCPTSASRARACFSIRRSTTRFRPLHLCDAPRAPRRAIVKFNNYSPAGMF